MRQIYKNVFRTAVTFFVAILVSLAVVAKESTQSLHTKRVETVLRYLHDLQTANSQDILELFSANAKVISTSQGEVPAKTFYQSFLSQVRSAQINLVNLHKSESDPDHYFARFRFQWTMKNDETGSGDFTDEFIFHPNTSILDEVIMVENNT